MAKRYYIAYGSNLNIPQMRMRCPSAKVIGTSVLENYQLLFKGSKTGSYLTIEERKGSEVPVVIWSVTDEDDKALDMYEGYPRFYYKKDIEVTVKGIKTGRISKKKAFVYVMHEERKLGVPRQNYMETCLYGYKSFGFDKKYIFDALEISVRDKNESR